MAVGPGLGHEPVLAKVVLRLIKECPLPLVIDARALSILSTDMSMLAQAQAPRVLTPHLGEMRSMTGLTVEAIEKDRVGTAHAFAKKYNCVLLLKGHNSVVASPKKVYVNRTGNAGMATAGSGDVLTGMAAAFLAQDIEPFEATKTACYLHGKAGDIAAKRKGKVSMIASDIIDGISDAIGKK
jgi:NAD(P)H-hydrate epimerase